MSLGLAMIARDEEESLPRLLASIEGAFDQVVLLDTGSVDRTVEVFERWAAREAPPLGYKIGRFKWRDDFAAARNAADELLDTDWLCWADAVDVIVGADRLREVVAAASSLVNVDAIRCPYDSRYADPRAAYAHGPTRLYAVRRGTARWVGRLHENLAPIGGPRGSTTVPPDVCRWVHRVDVHQPRRSARNIRIAKAWVEDEPHNDRARLVLMHETIWAANWSILQGLRQRHVIQLVDGPLVFLDRATPEPVRTPRDATQRLRPSSQSSTVSST